MDKKPPKKISRAYLENAALYYLQRYATSAENLRRVMMRKVKKSCAFHQLPVGDFAPLVDELVTRYMSAGLVDDAVFARARVASLRRQGLSRQAIMARLQAKGLSRAQIESALKLVDEDQEDPEMTAARACARRKKLGPWRKTPLTDPKALQKELAALGRAGFGYEVARRVLDFKED
jgi:regulatory protein